MIKEIEDHQLAIERLCRQNGVERLILFGSATEDHFDPDRSDLDFLAVFQTMTPKDYADAFFNLSEGLQRLFSARIDLVTEPALANPQIHAQPDV